VTANLNPAAYLVDKRRRLGLDETQLETVRAFEATYNARYADGLARYDSLRAQVQMARNRVSGAMGPTTEEQEIARERTIVLSRVMAALREQRDADVIELVGTLPEDKRVLTQELLTEQAESPARALRRSGPEGVAAAGGSAERSP
jgi:hypothetical protein